jgi:hypothetical protein
MIRFQRNQSERSLELWTRRGSWFWMLSDSSNGRGVVGAAPSAHEAARDACATLEETAPGDELIDFVPAMLNSALTWSQVLERFGRDLGGRASPLRSAP